MKRFIIELLIFASVSFVAVFIIGDIVGVIIQSTGNNILNNADYKVNEAIMRSKQRIKTKHLIIGESVGSQLYGNCADSVVYSLTATVAITDVGEYLLLAKFLDVNKEQLPEDVIMIYNPLCWNNTLTGGLVYSTFVKNFYNDDYIRYMDAELIENIKKFPLAFLCKYKAYQYSPYIPNVEQVTQDNGKHISPIQFIYLKKIYNLCKENGVKFTLTAGPIRASKKKEVQTIRNSDDCFLNYIFDGYFESLLFLHDDYYIDAYHMKKEYIPKDYLRLYE